MLQGTIQYVGKDNKTYSFAELEAVCKDESWNVILRSYDNKIVKEVKMPYNERHIGNPLLVMRDLLINAFPLEDK